MTNNPDTQPMVTEAARKAASAIVELGNPGVGNGNKVIADEIKGGLHDNYNIVQALARFEAETIARSQETARSADVGEPVAYMRRWAFDGDEGTRGNRPRGWKLHAVTQVKALPDDVPLYTSTPPADDGGLRSALEVILGSGREGTWAALVEPLVARFDVAANFGGNAVHNPEGSSALAELIREMATRLDRSVDRARAALSGGAE